MHDRADVLTPVDDGSGRDAIDRVVVHPDVVTDVPVDGSTDDWELRQAGARRWRAPPQLRDDLALIVDREEQLSCAFLELAEPSIPDGIEACIQAGAEEVIVLPYFLSAGRHVQEDIPREVAGKQQEHPRIPIRLAPYLGSA